MTDQRSPSRCPCCHGPRLVYLCFSETRDGSGARIWSCEDCYSIVPVYVEEPAIDLVQQTGYHAELWTSSTVQELQRTADDCRHIVRFYYEQLPPITPPGPILEIGSGRGSLIEAFRREGRHAVGCEPSPQLRAMGLAAYNLPETAITNQDALTFLRSQTEPVAAIFAWHVIEHLDHALEILRAAKDVLLPEGLIIAQVPQLHCKHLFPQHLFLLSRRTVYGLAARLGMKVTFVGLSPREQFLSFTLALEESHWDEWAYTPEDFWTDFLRDQMRVIEALVIEAEEVDVHDAQVK